MNRFENSGRRSDAIRSEIDQTRQRMDSTIDALAERLRGRHLADELLGWFRSSDNGRSIKERISGSAGTAVHAVVDAVKAHPLPMVVMGAGLAWLIYENEERKHPGRRGERERTGGDLAYDEDMRWEGTDRLAGEQGALFEDETRVEYASGAKETIARKAGEVKEDLQRRSSELKEKARSGMTQMRERAGATGTQLRQRARDLTDRTRDQLGRATREHPLESGLSFLALGLLAGMLAPTSETLRATVQPRGERLRERVREVGADMVERGKRVVTAATTAAREEAESQGLTGEAIRERMRGSNESSRVESASPVGEQSASPAGAVPPRESSPGPAGAVPTPSPETPDITPREGEMPRT